MQEYVLLRPIIRKKNNLIFNCYKKSLGDDHYKRMSRDTVGVAHQRTLTAKWPWVPSIGQNLQPFTGNGDVSLYIYSEKFSSGTINSKNKQTNKHKQLIICHCFVKESIDNKKTLSNCIQLTVFIIRIDQLFAVNRIEPLM